MGKTGQMWFAGKKMLRGEEKKMSDYVGTNEKTKIVVKITSQKGGAPVREPTVDEESQKKMMAFWHRKQEKDKELAEDDEDSYLQSQWVDPNALQAAFRGMGNVKIK